MKRFSTVIIAIFAIASAAVSADAESYTFDPEVGNSGVWDDADNWYPAGGPPSEDDTATIPNGKTCRVEDGDQSIHFLTIASGAVLQIKGKDLTMAGSDDPLNRLTVNGRLEFVKPQGGSDPRLLLDVDLGITGSGVVSASAGDDLGPGLIERTASANRVLTIDSNVTIKGSVKFHVWLNNDGLLLVDHGDDEMDIGYMSSQAYLIRVMGDSGTFRLTAGTMCFGRAWQHGFESNPFACKWKVEGGTMELRACNEISVAT